MIAGHHDSNKIVLLRIMQHYWSPKGPQGIWVTDIGVRWPPPGTALDGAVGAEVSIARAEEARTSVGHLSLLNQLQLSDSLHGVLFRKGFSWVIKEAAQGMGEFLEP